ncbi:hypothetical protein MIND_00210000 [Mycena indigotica]|uniref:Uncharacterized protein n=1 Tax=Mycena indigotica TaxID=2126181 RepID=A0A8H6T8M9_9AGAR|nr:uncharacterized protein MIND_00210000 [Mycena indigotica]KAF7311982.1 hypothetical protein MIND_00210000 [Mycena indigotica]
MAAEAPPYPVVLPTPADPQPPNGVIPPVTTTTEEPQTPTPRKRGRPKGSKNKSTLALEAAGVIDKDKRPTAPRPPRDPDAPKRPVGRPRKERGEWIEMAASRPDDFLHVLLTTLDIPNPPSNAGPSLEDAFKSHLVSLSQQPSQQPSTSASTAQPIPSLYSILKTFWLPSSPAYFSLTASAGTGGARVPSSHRFLYWDPLPLVFNGIPCPTCSAPLVQRGRIRSGPLTIHDLSGPFFVIGCSYVCEPAGHAFASTDSSVRAALPELLEREFPARLMAGDLGVGADVWSWQARGVSRALWNLVMGGLKSGLSKDIILQLVRTVQHGVQDIPKPLISSVVAPPPKKEDEDEEPEVEPEEDAFGETAAESPTTATTLPQQPQQLPPAASPATQAYHDAWTANSVVAGSSAIPPPPINGLPPTQFRPVTALPFYQGMVPYDPAQHQRKRPYPFDDSGHPHPIPPASRPYNELWLYSRLSSPLGQTTWRLSHVRFSISKTTRPAPLLQMWIPDL